MTDEVQAPIQLLKPTLFLAGSITGAWNWQAEVVKRLISVKAEIVIFNPRRDNFNVLDTKAEELQIAWEARHLRIADAIMFYFSGETLAPITLFELGRHSIIAGRPLFVGCDPEYKRKRDVKIQMKLVRSDVYVHDHIDHVIFDIQDWAKSK